MNIPNLAHYNTEMKKSLIDKMFFIDKVDADVIIDFGCADGILIGALHSIFPEKTYFGYDISEEQLEQARKNNSFAQFYSDWADVEEVAKNTDKKTCLVLNSVIHEVYSYGSKDDIETFWKRVYESGFDYVVIRDMAVSRTASRPSNNINVIKVKKKYDIAMLNEFEYEWGSITENWSLIHFLLKYRYTKNWSREVKENYLPINWENLVSLIPDNYNPIFSEHFVLPFIREQVRKDFDIDLQDNTHVKLILKAKE